MSYKLQVLVQEACPEHHPKTEFSVSTVVVTTRTKGNVKYSVIFSKKAVLLRVLGG